MGWHVKVDSVKCLVSVEPAYNREEDVPFEFVSIADEESPSRKTDFLQCPISFEPCIFKELAKRNDERVVHSPESGMANSPTLRKVACLFCKFSEELKDIGKLNTIIVGFQVDKNTACYPVQVAYQGNLLRPFLPIFLIDVYSVNPEVPGLVFKSKLVQGVPAVQNNLKGEILRLWDGPMVETEEALLSLSRPHM